MAFIGNQPTAVPLTSSQLADGLITTAKLAADAVTSAKIADSTIVNADIASTTINLTQKVTGTLPATNGGTGVASYSAGNILYATNATTLAALAPGTSGHALTLNGTTPTWSAVGASAGQVIQVISASDSTERSSASNSFVTANNTLAVTITPSSTANKILIMVDTFLAPGGSGGQYRGTIFRGSTNLGDANTGMAYMSTGISGAGGCHIYDSPNTTSSITYQFYFRATQANETVYINISNGKSSITCMEVKG